ncbi:MAG: hypothetical protein ABSH50_32720 [Bryobacteraceae bacterium]
MTVLLKLMVDAGTPASSRIRAALGIVEIGRDALDFELETRMAAMGRALAETKNKR